MTEAEESVPGADQNVVVDGNSLSCGEAPVPDPSAEGKSAGEADAKSAQPVIKKGFLLGKGGIGEEKTKIEADEPPTDTYEEEDQGPLYDEYDEFPTSGFPQMAAEELREADSRADQLQQMKELAGPNPSPEIAALLAQLEQRLENMRLLTEEFEDIPPIDQQDLLEAPDEEIQGCRGYVIHLDRRKEERRGHALGVVASLAPHMPAQLFKATDGQDLCRGVDPVVQKYQLFPGWQMTDEEIEEAQVQLAKVPGPQPPKAAAEALPTAETTADGTKDAAPAGPSTDPPAGDESSENAPVDEKAEGDSGDKGGTGGGAEATGAAETGAEPRSATEPPSGGDDGSGTSEGKEGAEAEEAPPEAPLPDIRHNLFKDYRVDMTAGEVGCAISHHRVWVDAYERGAAMVLVLEDDILLDVRVWDELREELRQLEEQEVEWDLIYLGRQIGPHTHDGRRVTRKLVEAGLSHCTHAYMLSARGVHKLLQCGFERFVLPVDEFLPALYATHPRPDVNKLVARLPRLTALAWQVEGEGRKVRGWGCHRALIWQQAMGTDTAELDDLEDIELEDDFVDMPGDL